MRKRWVGLIFCIVFVNVWYLLDNGLSISGNGSNKFRGPEVFCKYENYNQQVSKLGLPFVFADLSQSWETSLIDVLRINAMLVPAVGEFFEVDKNFHPQKVEKGTSRDGILNSFNIDEAISFFSDGNKNGYPVFFTIIQDPIARSVASYSYYLFAENEPDFQRFSEYSLEELLANDLFFMENGMSSNGQTLILANITGYVLDEAAGCGWPFLLEVAKSNLRNIFSGVGIMESFSDSLELFASFLPWLQDLSFYGIDNFDLESYNITERELELLKIANREDLELYEYALKLFQDQYDRLVNIRYELYSWGNNDHGQLGLGLGLGLGVGLEENEYTIVPHGLKVPIVDFLDGVPKKISCSGGVWDWTVTNANFSGGFSLLLSNEGNVYSTGYNSFGQLGLGDLQDRYLFEYVFFEDNVTIVDIAAGYRHALALTDDGKIYAWGDSEYGQCGIVEFSIPRPRLLTDMLDFEVTKIAAGGRTSLVLTSDESLYGFGYNLNNLLHSLTPSIENVHNPAMIEDIPLGVSISDICAASRHFLILTTEGNVIEWGWDVSNDSFLQRRGQMPPRYVDFSISTNNAEKIIIESISCRGGMSMAVSTDGELFSWGHNGAGNLGIGSQDPQYYPVKVTGVLSQDRIVETLSTYDYWPGRHGGSIFALTDNGKVFRWGANYYSEQGQFTDKIILSPEIFQYPLELPKFLDSKFVPCDHGSNFLLLKISDEFL